MLSSSTVAPRRRLRSARTRPTILSSARANESSRNTCDPMWQCIPANCERPRSPTTRRTAASASPLSSPKPNFESSVPGLDELVRVRFDAGRDAHLHARRRATVRREHARGGRARRTSRRRCGRRRPRARARSSSSDLLLPWNTMRSVGNRRAARRCSSPPVATSRSRPSSATSRAIAVHRNALLAYAAPAPKPARYSRHRAPELVLVVDVQRRAELVGELGEVDAADGDAPVGVDRRGPRQQRQVERRVVTLRVRRSSSRRAISSGACTPRSASALASPIRHASVSHSRAWVSSASSVSTRQSR